MESKTAALIVFVIIGFSTAGYLYYDNTIKTEQYTSEISSLNSNIISQRELLNEKDELISEKEAIIQVKNGEIDEKNEEIENLQDDNIDYQNEISFMEMNVIELESEIFNKKVEISSLKTQIENKENEFWQIQTEYSFKESLKIGNNLTSFYDSVRYQYGLAGDKNRWASERDKLEFGAKLALHDLGNSIWPSIESDFNYEFDTYSYTHAFERLQSVLTYCNVHGYNPSTKVSLILDFINENIDYSAEIDDIHRAPLETLGLGSGDCDDYSILAAALFEGAGIESAIAFMKNDYDEGHVLVLVRLDDLTITNPYYDGLYFYWEDLTHYQLQSGRWIIIEPQVPIEYQGDSEWIEQWDLVEVVEIYR